MTTTNRDIENIFMVSVAICPVCKGSRSVMNTDGSYSPCSCVYKESFIKYLGDLKKYVSLKDTPLLEHLKTNRDLVIEYDQPLVLYSHIKTALLRRKVLTKTWKIMTPDEVMSRSFNDEQRKDLYSCDLLIINSLAFTFYEAAGKQHEYVIKTRQALGKTTWFCTEDMIKLFERVDLKSLTPDLKKLLASFKKIKLNKHITESLLKDKKGTKSINNLKMGSSIGEVNKDLLEIGNSSDDRIQSYR